MIKQEKQLKMKEDQMNERYQQIMRNIIVADEV